MPRARLVKDGDRWCLAIEYVCRVAEGKDPPDLLEFGSSSLRVPQHEKWLSTEIVNRSANWIFEVLHNDSPSDRVDRSAPLEIVR